MPPVFQVGANVDWNGGFLATRHSLRREVVLRLYYEGSKDLEELILATSSVQRELARHLKALHPLVVKNSFDGKYELTEAGSKVANLLLLEEAVMQLGKIAVSDQTRKIRG